MSKYIYTHIHLGSEKDEENYNVLSLLSGLHWVSKELELETLLSWKEEKKKAISLIRAVLPHFIF